MLPCFFGGKIGVEHHTEVGSTDAAVPQEVIDATAQLYSSMFTRLTGQEF